MEKLAALSQELNDLSEALNSRLAEEEDKLRKAGAHCRAQVQLGDGVTLIWGKRDTGWCLGLRYADDKPGAWEAVYSSQRDLRLQALQAIPELTKALVARTEQLVAQTRAIVMR